MEGILRVTPDKLISTANEFNATGAQVRSLTQNMLDTVNSMQTVWQGEAASAYQTKFNSLQDDMEKMNRMIEEHVRDLNEMAVNYRQAEAVNTENSNALSGDIIQ